jgi:hypothetical protein
MSTLVYAMAKPQDEYELHPTHSIHDRTMEQDAEPLLPRYTAEPGSSSPIKLADKDEDRKRRKAKRKSRRTVQCIVLSLLVALLGFGLAGCYFGKSGLNRVRGWHTWEQVPPEWREWLNSVVPSERQHADHGAFPTE